MSTAGQVGGAGSLRVGWKVWIALGLGALCPLGCDNNSCTDDTCETDSTCDTPPCDTDPDDPVWGVLADQVGNGVLLSAWSAGDEALLVGGDLGGGPGLLARYDTERLCVESAVTDKALWWIHGATADAWYAVGVEGVVLHDVGGVRTREDVPTLATLFGVYDDGTAVWAVGGSITEGTGEIWRKQGDTWSLFAGDLPGVVFKVWDRWVVGDDVAYEIVGEGLVAHPTGERMLTVRGRDAVDVWTVGGSTSAHVLHRESDAWVEVDVDGLYQPLNGVWTAPGEAVWIAGNFGTAAYLDGDTWVTELPPFTTEHFHAVWKHGDEMLFVGGNLFSVGDNYGTVGVYGPSRAPLTATECPSK